MPQGSGSEVAIRDSPPLNPLKGRSIATNGRLALIEGQPEWGVWRPGVVAAKKGGSWGLEIGELTGSLLTDGQRSLDTMRPASRFPHPLLIAAGFAILFFVLQKLTFLLRFPPFERTAVWVPGALTFTALLILPWRQWWSIYVGLCVGAFTGYYGEAHISGGLALIAAQFHFTMVAAGAAAIRRFWPQPLFANVGSLFVFVLTAGVLVPLATSAPIDLFRWWSGASDVWPVAVRSFLCTSLGMLIATPPFTVSILEFPDWRRHFTWGKCLEITLLMLLIVGVGLGVFTSTPPADVVPALIYAPIPFLLWAALRFEIGGTGWALLILAYISTWSAVYDYGPFVAGNRADHVLQLQLFLLALSLPLMFMAASVKERRRAFSALVHETQERTRMENQFRLVVESAPNAMLIVDRQGRVLLMNQQITRSLGYATENVMGQSWSMLFPSRFKKLVDDRLHQFFSSATLGWSQDKTQWCARRNDGSEIPVEIELTPISNQFEPMALATLIDQSQRRKAEEAQRDLVHASRLAVLSEFTASLAHEINQPLAAILSNAEAGEMLLGSASPPLDEIRRILVDIRQDDLRASDVIRKLRALFRRDALERQSIKIRQVVDDVVTLLRSESQRRGVEVVVNSISEDSLVLGDPIHLQQILLNLMANAMEAMVEIKGHRRLTISIHEQGESVVVSVADSGPGIPADVMPKLFERFFSTKPDGMGMGLAITRSLVEEHGGRLWAENQAGGGAKFCFRLPLMSAVIQTLV